MQHNDDSSRIAGADPGSGPGSGPGRSPGSASQAGRWAAALGQLLELVVLLNADMTGRLARDGLTTSRTHILWVLRHRGPSTQRVLADDLKVTPRTITGLIDGLAATGFVTREQHPTDRRATLVTFTPRGVAMVDTLEQEQAGFTELLFGGMSEARFAGLTAGLADVLDRIRPHLPAPVAS